MAGSKFQYDESGGTFFYFILSFLALVVIPCTYYFWPKEEKKEEIVRDRKKCHCQQCGIKCNSIRAREPWRKAKQRIIKFLLILGWIALAACAYKVAHLQHDYVNYDPFEILGIDPASSSREIKKAYHKLSLIYHPDKEGGDERKFLMISKAYAALTDEESRKNWEMYGNPDGPGATSFGIALPSWIVEKENSVIVLGLYALVFMIALPTIVGIWWYNSVKYGGDQVLLDTTQLFYCFIHKTPHMVLKRVIMIIAAAMEFEKSHNSEIVERISDQVEVHALIRELQNDANSNLNEKNKERPLCYPYSIKARCLLYAHLYRIKLPANTLDLDRQYVVKKCPALIAEFVQNVSQLTMLALAGRIPRTPSLDTLECAMRLSSLIVQAVYDNRSTFYQLPHVTDDIVRLFTIKKWNCRSLESFAKMNNQDRKLMLRVLSDDQLEDMLIVLGDMPIIELSTKCEVLDDEDSSTITAGAIVTVTATLKRNNYKNKFNIQFSEDNNLHHDHQDKVSNFISDENQDNEPLLANGDSLVNHDKPTKPIWVKKDTKKKGKGKSKAGKQQQVKKQVAPPVQSINHVQESSVAESSPKVDKMSKKKKKSKQDEDDEDNVSQSDNVSGDETDTSVRLSDDDGDKDLDKDQGSESESDVKSDEEMEERDWTRINNKNKKSKQQLDGKSRLSHSVHCPYFPEDKQEYWWIYIADRKKHSLITSPVLMTHLVDEESVELKFTAPHKPGLYTYTVVVKSDSYLDNGREELIKLDVKEAKVILDHPQWDIEDEDEKEDEEGDESAVSDPDLVDDSEDEDGDKDGAEDSDLDVSSEE